MIKNQPEEYDVDRHSAGSMGHLGEDSEGQVHVEGGTVMAAVPIHS